MAELRWYVYIAANASAIHRVNETFPGSGHPEMFHEALRSARIKPQKVLCLGLGSPSLSRDARTQLALLSHLCGSVQIVRGFRTKSKESSVIGSRAGLGGCVGVRSGVHRCRRRAVPGLGNALSRSYPSKRFHAAALKFQTDSALQGAEHALDYPTLLYMPHCDLRLYESVIRANWSLDGLSRILFLSNSFGDYVDKCVLRC